MQQFISSYGYLAVFILMLAESACIPVPSELTMLFAGALSAGAVAGVHLNLGLAIAAGVAGNVAGSYLAWGIGIYGGRAAWHRWGRYILLRDDDIDRGERWFDRHGTKAVFFGRLLPVVRTFISLPAGLARMPPAGSGSTPFSAASRGPRRWRVPGTWSERTGATWWARCTAPATRWPPCAACS